jgi:hypothetical protein
VQLQREANCIRFLVEQLQEPSDLGDAVAHHVALFTVAL